MYNVEEKHFLTRGKAILFGVILVIALIVVLSIKSGKSNHVKQYKDFESELKFAAENYVIINNIYIDDGEEKRITKKMLSSKNLIYNELKDKCDGYVVATSDKNLETKEYEITYIPYIKCGRNYMTPNYSEY